MKKKNIYVVIAITVLAVLAVFLSNNSPKMMGQYLNVEEYLTQQASHHKTVELVVWETPFVVMADRPVEVTVVDRKLEYLTHCEELDERDSRGTLETWHYNWLIKINPDDIDRASIVLTARGMDEDGYFCQSTGQFVLALRYPDGSYDVFGEVPLLESVDIFAQRNNA